MAINDVVGERVYHEYILNEFLGQNFVSGFSTLKPLKNYKTFKT